MGKGRMAKLVPYRIVFATTAVASAQASGMLHQVFDLTITDEAQKRGAEDPILLADTLALGGLYLATGDCKQLSTQFSTT